MSKKQRVVTTIPARVRVLQNVNGKVKKGDEGIASGFEKNPNRGHRRLVKVDFPGYLVSIAIPNHSDYLKKIVEDD